MIIVICEHTYFTTTHLSLLTMIKLNKNINIVRSNILKPDPDAESDNLSDHLITGSTVDKLHANKLIKFIENNNILAIKNTIHILCFKNI